MGQLTDADHGTSAPVISSANKAEHNPPAGETCGHCNSPVKDDTAAWKYEIGFWFCPACKHSYWEPTVK